MCKYRRTRPLSFLIRRLENTFATWIYLIFHAIQNHIFVVKDAGFVAYAIAGSYDVLAVVDQTHLTDAVKDHVTGSILGYKHEVKMISKIGQVQLNYVAALLYVLSQLCY